jgi:simple sugar transport system permease protein
MAANVAVAWMAMIGRMGDVLAGLVFDIAMIGLTGVLAAQFFASGLTLGKGSLDAIKFLGENPIVYVLLAVVVALELLFRRTSLGLTIRAAGEAAEAARVLGVRLVRLRLWTAAWGGGLIGLGGAALSVGVVGTFENNMTNGWGFVAIAVVYFGAWQPWGALLGALVFGFADTIQFYSGQHAGSFLNQLIVVLPYLCVVGLAAAGWGQSRAPAEETSNLEPTL